MWLTECVSVWAVALILMNVGMRAFKCVLKRVTVLYLCCMRECRLCALCMCGRVSVCADAHECMCVIDLHSLCLCEFGIGFCAHRPGVFNFRRHPWSATPSVYRHSNCANLYRLLALLWPPGFAEQRASWEHGPRVAPFVSAGGMPVVRQLSGRPYVPATVPLGSPLLCLSRAGRPRPEGCGMTNSSCKHCLLLRYSFGGVWTVCLLAASVSGPGRVVCTGPSRRPTLCTNRCGEACLLACPTCSSRLGRVADSLCCARGVRFLCAFLKQ